MVIKNIYLLAGLAVIVIGLIIVRVRSRQVKMLIDPYQEIIDVLNQELSMASERNVTWKKVRIKSMGQLPNITYFYKEIEGSLGRGIINYHLCLEGLGIYLLDYEHISRETHTYYSLTTEQSVKDFRSHMKSYAKNYFGNT